LVPSFIVDWCARRDSNRQVSPQNLKQNFVFHAKEPKQGKVPKAKADPKGVCLRLVGLPRCVSSISGQVAHHKPQGKGNVAGGLWEKWEKMTEFIGLVANVLD